MAKPSKKSPIKKSDNAQQNKFQKPSQKPFKQKPQSDPKPQPQPLQLEDDAPDFPRGGRKALSKEELEEVRAEVDAEFESEQRALKKKRKDRSKNTGPQSNEDDELGSLFGDGITGKLPKYANKITLKNISPGMKLWGVISEVNEKDIIVSLPGGLRGLVHASEALDPLLHDEVKWDGEGFIPSTLYHVGQLVSCIVLQLGDDKKDKGKQKVWLSLRLALLHKGFALDILQEGMVLTAYVKSIEDHGYMLHFGLPSFTGFMPSTTESEAGKHDVKVHIGQLVQGVVKSIDRIRKVVHLSSDPDEVSKCVTKDLKGISMDLLIPGMMVNARVRSTLENGVMLSFLTYFTGTVDLYHLQKTLPTSNWKDEYSQNKKVNARILFIDPSTRAIGLTLNPHLVLNKAPPSLVKTGDIYEHSKVIRVDRGSGLLLEIPSSPVPTPAYVNVSDVADKEVRKLEKAFKEGSQVRVRVLGFRHLEGLATGVLKTSAFEGSVFTHSDVKPGMVIKARVIAVESFGAIVQLASGVKALCPLRHMSEFEITKPRKKFQVGIDMVFRVLGCKSKRITVTHKKTLVKSKLEILSSYADATEGLLTHGWITKIEKHGCFVHFYNGVHGFAPRSELGLDPGSDTSSMYHVEQVVKCRVTSSTPASHRISLSFIVTPTRASEDEMVKLGSVVSGIVERVTPHAVIIDVDVKGYTKGTISAEHLADNHGLAVLMKSALKPGYRFDNLLVLGGAAAKAGPRWIYPSLLGHLTSLAASLIVIDNYLQGYVCNIIDSGCFVRFVGRLTGFAPKNRAIDDRKADLSEVFYIGQSIRSNILDLNSETGRITVSLKQSLCSSTDASFIQEYFLLEEKIAKLQTSGSDGSDLKWVDDFSIGTVIEGKVREKKESGVVISFQKYDDVFGFITHYQLGGATAEIGSTVRAIVLDVAKIDHLVDLSLKPELVGRSREENSNTKKKRKRLANEGLEVHQTVNAVIEIMKENYVVVSIPEKNYTLGYASLTDYNTQGSRPNQFANGQSVVATIMALPNPSNAGRLLLLLKSVSEMTETSSSKRAKKNSNYHVGSLVQAEVTEMKPLELRVKFGSSFHGRIHITEASDDNSLEDPFNNLRIGQTLTARIVSNANNSEHNKKGFRWELSIKPSVLSGFTESMLTHDFSYSTGEYVTGFVYKVDTDWVWLTISRDVRAQLYILDSACESDELKDFQKRFCVGKAVSGYILSTNKEKKMLRLLVHPLPTGDDRVIDQGSSLINDPNGHSSEKLTYHICEGAVVGGRITKVLPGVGGLLVQVDPHLFGKVHFTELNDLWLPSPLSGYHEGQLVKCKVLGTSRSGLGKEYIDLSLRASSVGLPNRKSLELSSDVYSSSDRKEKIEDLQTDMVVQGYVKSVTPKGCFIMLSRKLDAKILLSNLSDGYVKHPDQEFPIGKLVSGKVISLEPLSKRIEVTLRTSSGMKQAKSGSLNFSSLHVGEIINGTIKRIEAYGLFITIDQSNVVGLCHVSELPEDRAGNIESQYKPGERVRAKILKVDEEQHRVSFGMKTSYADDDMGIETASEPGSDDDMEENDQVLDNILPMLPQSISAGVQDLGVHYENGKHPILAEVESRASIPALEVPLDDDTETSPVDDSGGQSPQHVDNKSETASKANQRAKKKEKGEREREIIAAEERLLEKDLPRTADEFEKLVRSSPNSSFVWIKYMGFMLSLSDIEKARSIAERALRTINIREESEKLNIWVAYFNLENQYGDPPEDAVVKLFQRALQYCDPKKVHLALLGVYERTEQHKLADELLDKMLKKFKHSCKVWLRRIQSLLKQNQDGVQSVVNRALICLPKHKHIKFISQTAILEFKGGVPDRGRSMFEGMLREYPKRTDLWSVYLDQEIRLGDVDLIRALFERAISLSLPPKKMKFLFKKYLEFEKSHGDEELIEYVKRKALEYVESSAA